MVHIILDYNIHVAHLQSHLPTYKHLKLAGLIPISIAAYVSVVSKYLDPSFHVSSQDPFDPVSWGVMIFQILKRLKRQE